MEDQIKQFALKLSVIVFFMFGFIGYYFNHRPETCCVRAMLGASVCYFLIFFTGKLILRIIVINLAKTKIENEEKKRDKKQQ